MLDLVLPGLGCRPAAVVGRLVRTWSDDAGTVFARAFVAEPARWLDWPGIGTFEFTLSSPEVRLYPTTGNLDRARDTFARIVQPIVLQAQGVEVLHASAVAGPDGSVILAGTTGNGKSTLAWALGRVDGYRQIADDAVVIERIESNEALVRQLPFRPRLRPPSLQALPTAPSTPDETIRPDTATRLPLCAIVLLEQNVQHAGPPVTARLVASEAFTSVLTHAYAFDDDDRAERDRMTRHYLALAATVPVVRLTYRPDFAALPLLIDTLLGAIGDAALSRA